MTLSDYKEGDKILLKNGEGTGGKIVEINHRQGYLLYECDSCVTFHRRVPNFVLQKWEENDFIRHVKQ